MPSAERMQPTHIFQSSALPIDARVSDKIRGKIWANEYIDFGLLMSNPLVEQGYRLAVKQQGDSPAISLEPITRPKKIQSIDAWVKCFHVFVGVFTSRFPAESPALMKYGEIVQDLAARGFNWKFYDENFRYLRQSQHASLPWGVIHWELWLRAQSNSNVSKQSQPEPSRSFSSGFQVPNGFCYRYHRGQFCPKVKCPFKHSCFKCEGDHRATNCSFRGTGKPSARQHTSSTIKKSTSNSGQQ